MKTQFRIAVSSCFGLLLVGCTAAQSHHSLAGSAITHVHSATVYFVKPKTDVATYYVSPNSASDTIGMMFGAIGGAVTGAMHASEDAEKSTQLAKNLEPYQPIIQQLELYPQFYNSVRGTLKRVSWLSHADYIRKDETKAGIDEVALANAVNSQAVVFVYPAVAIRAPTANGIVHCRIVLYARDSVHHRIFRYDQTYLDASMPIKGGSTITKRKSDESNNESMDAIAKQYRQALSVWFANNGRLFEQRFTSTLQQFDHELEIYFGITEGSVSAEEPTSTFLVNTSYDLNGNTGASAVRSHQ